MKIKVVLIGFLLPLSLFAQEEEKVYFTFEDTRVINGQSVETSREGEFKFIISHRFGRINEGEEELFGLDNSTARIGFDYGITDRWQVGVGRSSLKKTFDFFTKYKLVQQKENSTPISITAFSSLALDSRREENLEFNTGKYSDRLTYAYQIIVARKFNPKFSLQLMPTLVHKNLRPTPEEENDIFAIGAAFRYQVLKNLAITGEYYFVPQDQIRDEFYNPVSLGFDINTKGHVFQVHLSSSRGMIEQLFITETTGQVEDWDLHLGFNISRTWKFKGRKYH